MYHRLYIYCIPSTWSTYTNPKSDSCGLVWGVAKGTPEILKTPKRCHKVELAFWSSFQVVHTTTLCSQSLRSGFLHVALWS